MARAPSVTANPNRIMSRLTDLAASLSAIALWAMAALVSGCVSVNSVTSEEQFLTPPDPSQVCAYAWKADEVLFRAENVYSYHWAAPSAFGYGDIDGYAAELWRACDQRRSPDVARLSLYYLEYGSKVYGHTMRIPMALITGLSLGTMPLPFFRSYTVCAEANLPHGQKRLAMAEGSVSTLANIWGMGNSKYNEGETEAKERRARLMRDLASQAWHKLWLADGQATGTESCRHRLETLIGRAEASEGVSGAKAPARLPEQNKVESPSDDFVNCASGGKRQWTYRSSCD
jgi:hypothetical protein